MLRGSAAFSKIIIDSNSYSTFIYTQVWYCSNSLVIDLFLTFTERPVTQISNRTGDIIRQGIIRIIPAFLFQY
jgi:hypothetical protein